jgi:hypothetical protein
MILFAEWSEAATALTVGLTSALGTTIIGLWFFVGSRAQKLEAGRREELIATYNARNLELIEQHRQCREDNRHLEDQLRALEKEFRETVWKLRQEFQDMMARRSTPPSSEPR